MNVNLYAFIKIIGGRLLIAQKLLLPYYISVFSEKLEK